MTFIDLSLLTLSCFISQTPAHSCLNINAVPESHYVAGVKSNVPVLSGNAVDVVLTAKAALVWDIASDTILYSNNASEHRPIASLSKLASALSVRKLLPLDLDVTIGSNAKNAARAGANIKLPAGETTSVEQLLAAGMIASANDAMVVLAEAASGSEKNFSAFTNQYLQSFAINDTQISNATGLTGGQQFSTATDVKKLLMLIYKDTVVGPFLSQSTGVLITNEGTHRRYTSTNKLLSTYVPVKAAKTGFTPEAGENLALITVGANGQEIGAVILGSEQRFQDMKVLIEWIWRNYSWDFK